MVLVEGGCASDVLGVFVAFDDVGVGTEVVLEGGLPLCLGLLCSHRQLADRNGC
jgi:hypothetical protein